MAFLAVALSFLLGIIAGIFGLFFFSFFRGRRHGWDDSNMTNMLRIWSHLLIHPGDFLKMYYKDGSRPFWYLSEDEFSEVVKTRPKE